MTALILSINGRMKIGGEELVAMTACNELKKRGFEIYELTTDGPLLSEFEKIVQVLHGRVNKRTPWGLLSGSHDIIKHVVEKRINIIYTHSLGPAVMALLAKRKIQNKKLHIVWHNHGVHNISNLMAGMLFNKLDMVVCNSNYTKEILLHNGLNPQNACLIYNCICMNVPEKIQKDRKLKAEYNISENDKVVGMISRIEPAKGHKYLLNAISILSSKLADFKNCKFIIVGSGSLLNNLQRKARKLNIHENVIFAGSRRDVERFYSIFDIFVLPSLEEPFGIVLLEAMRFAIPVVATKVGGIPEVVLNNETGFLVPPKDSESLANKLIELLNNAELRGKMGKAGFERETVFFSKEIFVNQIETMFYSLISDK